MNNTSYHEYLPSCCAIAKEAGVLIMTYFSGGFGTRRKGDKSPVTDADIAANKLITKTLSDLTPDIPVIAEEDEQQGSEGHALFWLVDPLDGTRSFVRGEPEFTVNIGLVSQGKPVIGVIYAPPQDALYYGEVGKGAWRALGGRAPESICSRFPASDGMVVTRSKSHPSPATEAYLRTLTIKQLISSSSSIKFCLLAEGRADLYPRFGRTMEWDTAAGHAILQAAGGRVETTDGKPLTYGKPGYENPHFIAYGK